MAMTQTKRNKLLLDLPAEPDLREQYKKATGLTDDDIKGASTQPGIQKAAVQPAPVQPESVQNGQSGGVTVRTYIPSVQYGQDQSVQSYANAFPAYGAFGQSAAPSGTNADYSFFQSQQRGQYASPYGAQIDSMLAQLDNYGTFSYDPEADPDYQAYRQIYTNLGRDAMENAIGTAAAATGGIASSYAASAAAQANNKYMSQLAGAVPELSQNAYTRWANERSDIYNRLSALMALENSDYSRFADNRDYEYKLSRDAVNDKRYADENDYKRWLDARNYLYQLSRDQISDARYTDETDYARYLDERNYLYQLERDAIGDNRYADALEYDRMINDRDFAYKAAMDKLNYEYQRDRDDIADARYADESDYQKYLDARNYDYQLSRDAVNDRRYADELEYSKLGDQRKYEISLAQLANDAAKNEKNAAVNTAKLAAKYGDLRGLQALGIDTSNYQTETGAEDKYDPLSDEVIDTIVAQARTYSDQTGTEAEKLTTAHTEKMLMSMYNQGQISAAQYIAALNKLTDLKKARTTFSDTIDPYQEAEDREDKKGILQKGWEFIFGRS